MYVCKSGDRMNEQQKINNIRASTRDIIQHLGYLDNLFAHIGSVSQCHALQKLEKHNLTPLELSVELGLDRSTVSRLAKGLVDKGYCTYQANDDDGRSRYLKLTKLGGQRLDEIHTTAIKQVESALSTLDDAEKELVSQGLSLYAKALKNSPTNGE